MPSFFETVCLRVEETYRTFSGGDTTVLFQRGALALAENQDKRRVVFRRPGGAATPSRRAGSTDLGDGRRVRMVKRREERVFAHVYAEDDAAADQLLDAVIACCEAVLGTGFQPGNYDWKTEDKQASLTKYTEIVVLEMRWHKVTLDQFEPLTQIELQGHACSFGDGDFNPADFRSTDFLTAGGEAAT